AAARLRAATHRNPAEPAGHRRSRRRTRCGVPDPSRTRPTQQCAHPQRPARRDPFTVPVRRPAPPRARRDDRPGPGHPSQTLRPWLRARSGTAAQPAFPTRQGHPLSVDAIQRRLAKHVTAAASTCRSLRGKRVSPHVLRHTCAMNLLHAGVDIATIALWLGHSDIRATQTYLHADLALKERALSRTTPPNTAPGRYRPPDPLLAFLEQL